MIRAFLWGTDPKIVHLSSGLPCKFTDLAIFSLDLAWQNVRSWKRKFRGLFRSVSLKNLLQKYRQKHWHVRITSFVYHFRDQILLIVNANSEFTWTTAGTVPVYKLFVFHCSWILGQYERNIVLIYILRASSLSCHDKIILFGFCVSLGSKNPYDLGSQIRFRILPKKRTLYIILARLKLLKCNKQDQKYVL